MADDEEDEEFEEGEEEEEDEVEEVALREARHQGQVLVLADGRTLRIHPSDATSTITWTPTVMLEISVDDSGLTFPLVVYNTDNEDEVHAMWSLPT